MKKKINTLKNNSSLKIDPTLDMGPTPSTDLTIIPQITMDDIQTPLEGEIIGPEIELSLNEGGPETPSEEPTPSTEEPISKRMDDLLILTLDPKSRLSGSHPTIKKSPKWMINPTFNGRERWMDLSKEYGWNIERKEIILKRSGIQHRGMEGFDTRPYNPETETDFTIRG